jgi:peptidoglycan/xylan/chitin deacetylase (PgdA/CDA1 family)
MQDVRHSPKSEEVASEITSMVNFACLTYHAVGNLQNQYTVTKKQLRDQLSLLRDEGFIVEGFEQLDRRFYAGRKFPSRYVVLTLDDGDDSSMVAADVIAEHGYTATFFLTRDRSQNKPGYIRTPQIRELRRRGFSLGTHGTTHRKLTFIPEKECVEELKDSKRWLEDTLGGPVSYMAAPGGYINARVMKQAADSGYVLIGTCNEWVNVARTMQLPSSVNRVNVRRHFSLNDLHRIVNGSLRFYLWRQARSAALALPKQFLRN